MSFGRSSPDRSCAAPSSTVMRASNVDSVKSRRCACATNRFGAPPRITAVDRGKHLYTTIGGIAQAPAIFLSGHSQPLNEFRRFHASRPASMSHRPRGKPPRYRRCEPFPSILAFPPIQCQVHQAPRRLSVPWYRRDLIAIGASPRRNTLRAVRGEAQAIHAISLAV